MKLKLLLALGMCASFSLNAFADEMDFFTFKTTKNRYAGATRDFNIKVRVTNSLNPSVDKTNEIPCTVVMSMPNDYICNVNGRSKIVRADLESVRELLTCDRVQDCGLKDLELREAKVDGLRRYAVFQARDGGCSRDIYHVVFDAPNVEDNTMTCLVGISSKNLASFNCRSEVNEAASFLVEDVPVSRSYGTYTFGGAGAAAEKLREVLTQVESLKKTQFGAAEATSLSLVFGSDQAASVYLQSRGSSAEAFRISGNVEHVHRGAVATGN